MRFGTPTQKAVFFAFLLTIGVFGPRPVAALDVPKRPQNYAHDEGGILSVQARNELDSALSRYERATTNQIVVAIFPSLEGEAIEDFTLRLAEAWRPGQGGKDNGVILAVFWKDRKIRIEVGYGLEGALTDAESGIIIRDVIAPYFKAEAFETGILAGVGAIIRSVEGEFTAEFLKDAAYGQRRPLTTEELAALRRQGLITAALIGASLIGLFVADVQRYRGYLKDHRLYRERYSFWEWFFRFAILLALLSFMFRMLFYMMLFSRGGYSGGGRGQGGFSGGGGSFGGGGATGSW